MTGEIPTGEHSVFHFLDIFALGCGLEACASFFKGESQWKVAGEVGSAIAFHLIGTKWPKIKNKLWPTLAELLDRINKNRWVRFGTLAIVLGYFTVSGGIHFYRKWFARTTSTQTMLSTSELPRGSPPTLVRPIITWTDPEPITFGSRLSSAQLNAKVNVDATPSYNHALGEVLPVGRYDLTVIFTPTDGTKYSKATQTVHLVVKKTHVAQPHAAVPNEGSAPAPPQSVPAAPIRPENSPNPVPIPPPSVSVQTPYSELKSVMDELQGLQMYWQLHSTSRYHSGDSRPVDPDYLRQTDDEVSRRWDDLHPKIIKAIDRALERMSASGPNEISPNEKNAFKTRLQQTMTMAQTRPTVDDLKAMKIDNNRFEPLLNLLGDLLKKLGDFPER